MSSSCGIDGASAVVVLSICQCGLFHHVLQMVEAMSCAACLIFCWDLRFDRSIIFVLSRSARPQCPGARPANPGESVVVLVRIEPAAPIVQICNPIVNLVCRAAQVITQYTLARPGDLLGDTLTILERFSIGSRAGPVCNALGPSHAAANRPQLWIGCRIRQDAGEQRGPTSQCHPPGNTTAIPR